MIRIILDLIFLYNFKIIINITKIPEIPVSFKIRPTHKSYGSYRQRAARYIYAMLSWAFTGHRRQGRQRKKSGCLHKSRYQRFPSSQSPIGSDRDTKAP